MHLLCSLQTPKLCLKPILAAYKLAISSIHLLTLNLYYLTRSSLQFDLFACTRDSALPLSLAKMQLGVFPCMTSAQKKESMAIMICPKFTEFRMSCGLRLQLCAKSLNFVYFRYGRPCLCTFKPPAVVQISHFAKTSSFTLLPPSSFLRSSGFTFYSLFPPRAQQKDNYFFTAESKCEFNTESFNIYPLRLWWFSWSIKRHFIPWIIFSDSCQFARQSPLHFRPLLRSDDIEPRSHKLSYPMCTTSALSHMHWPMGERGNQSQSRQYGGHGSFLV